MNWLTRLHFLGRAWRHRLSRDRLGIAFILARDLRGKVSVDVGANQGVYSYWMCRRAVGTAGRVVAFEPQPELAAYLRDLRESFHLHQLEVAESALSAQPGALTLRRPKTHWGGASLEHLPGDHGEVDLIPVTVTTLDSYFQNHVARPIKFIKCDVEAHEHHVFRGAHSILTNDRPDLLFECYDAANPYCEVVNYLNDLDYQGYCFFGNRLAPLAEYAALRPHMNKAALYDFVFLPQETSPP
ncbi:MAG: FkbM family methyltransferase [Planctomycetes bacterium]|nr:FkbM family methyltransferase [Planctomycetota bacterium]